MTTRNGKKQVCHNVCRSVTVHRQGIRLQVNLVRDDRTPAHAHNYQRYTRRLTFNGRQMQVPYLVAGTAGRGIQPLTAATGQVQGEVTYLKSTTGYGFLRVAVAGAAGGAASHVQIEFVKVEMTPQHQAKGATFDSITLALATSTIT
jgi:hypothetical protein